MVLIMDTNISFEEFYQNKKAENRKAIILFMSSILNLPSSSLIESNWNDDALNNFEVTAKTILHSLGVEVCAPFYDNNTPCYLTNKCSLKCPFKK